MFDAQVRAKVRDTDPTARILIGMSTLGPQDETLDELQGNLQEVVAMLLEDGAPRFESEFVGVQTIKVA